MNPPTATDNTRLRTMVLGIAILVGVLLRLTLRSSSTLWEDEIIAATHAVQPFGQAVVNILMNDMHPPLFFLELHVWSLVSHADWWFIANSVVFSLAALASLFVVQRRLAGPQVALASTAVLAVLPSPVWMGEEVRMYSWLSVLLIWMLYFVTRSFARPGGTKRDAAMVVLLAVAITFTHAIGFVAVTFFGLYAASWLVFRREGRARASWREWGKLVLVFGLAGLAILPMIASDLLHPADMPPLTGPADFAEWMAGVIVGGGALTDPGLLAVGAFVYLAVIGMGTVAKGTRRMTLCFLVAPMVFCIVTGLALRPLFKTNFFSTFFSPFLAVVIAQLLLSAPARSARVKAALAGGVLAGLVALSVINRHDLNPLNGYYRQAADTITAQRQPGDVVWAPQTDVFWGMAWYLVGPDWGSPLAIHPPMREGSMWWKIFDRLGPSLVERLHMMPQTQTVAASDGMPIMVAPSSEPAAARAKRVWVVVFPRPDLDPAPGPAMGYLHVKQVFDYPPVQVRLYE